MKKLLIIAAVLFLFSCEKEKSYVCYSGIDGEMPIFISATEDEIEKIEKLNNLWCLEFE